MSASPSRETRPGRLGTYAAWGFYLIVAFEILYMISPFALYFYSAYGPLLRFLDARPQTAWLTDFFLPHFSETSSALLNGLVEAGEPIFLAGLAVFAVGFVSIYSSKLLRRGRPVTFLLYRWVRHPQYVALAVMGVGVLLRWPRMAVLVAFVTMLFLYYFLARSEEERCLAKFGDSYRDYRRRTWMFLPGLGRRGGDAGKGRAGPAWRLAAAGVVACAVLVAASVAGAYRLRDYSLAHVSHISSSDVAVLSPARLSADELNRVVALAAGDPAVRARLEPAGAGGPAKLLVYVVPADWRLPDLPMELQKTGGHHTPSDFDRHRFKVLFTRALGFRPDAQGDDIIRSTVKRQPLVLVRVNTQAATVEAIEQPPATVRWGDISTPLF